MFEIAIILICVTLNGVFACWEAAFISADRFALKALADDGSLRGQLLLTMRRQPERILSVVQVGITFVGAYAAAIGGAGANSWISPWLINKFGLNIGSAELLSTLVIVIPLTYISVVFGELVPKTIALRFPIKIATRLVHVMSMLRRLLFPFVWIFEGSTKWVVARILPRSPDNQSKELGKEDLVSNQGREYIVNLIRIEQSQLTDALIDWKSVDHISTEDSVEAVEHAFIRSGHTRLPVTKAGWPIGILNSKEFFALRTTGNKDWKSIIRTPLNFSSNAGLLETLKALQRQSAQMGIVVHDNKPIGIITMEDIFEEIIGEIYDEDDFGSIQAILSKARL